MSGWRAAHRMAMFAASKAHTSYDVDIKKRIDVFDVISRAGIILAFQPLKKLSGAVVFEPRAPVGIIINSNHPPARQRYTAAHELGHYFMNHGASIDPDRDLVRDGVPTTEKEMLAEAFAAWFLMPRELVVSTLKRMGKATLTSPIDAYELSLRLGTSYESTVLHSSNLRLATMPRIRQWLREKPALLKKRLAGEFAPDDLKNDVWLFGETDTGFHAVVRPGDRVLVSLREIPSSGWRWQEARKSGNFPDLVNKHYLSRGIEKGQPAVGGPTDRTFVYAVPDAEITEAGVVSLINGPTWRNQVDREFNLRLSIEPPRKGFSADDFLVKEAPH